MNLKKNICLFLISSLYAVSAFAQEAGWSPHIGCRT
jgi:hypothetical protein